MKALKWENTGKHHIYQTDGCMRCVIPILEHSVGPANLEVFKSTYGWEYTFWHGNMGHSKYRHYKTREEAVEAAENHLLRLYENIKSMFVDKEAK